jgi:hypothetical protein
LAAPEHRSGWVRVDRLLGEHGLVDTIAGRQQFERRMEERRLVETDEAALKVFRRGWCLGSAQFKNQMLEKMEDELGEHHSGELRRENAEAKAQRIVAEELARRGWREADLAERRKGDPGKLAIAARLRQETTLSMKAITDRVKLGTSRSANMRLHKWMRAAAPLAANATVTLREQSNHTMGLPLFEFLILMAGWLTCRTRRAQTCRPQPIKP